MARFHPSRTTVLLVAATPLAVVLLATLHWVTVREHVAAVASDRDVSQPASVIFGLFIAFAFLAIAGRWRQPRPRRTDTKP